MGVARSEEAAKAIEAGFDQHLAKPVDEASLLAALTSLRIGRTPAGAP